MVPRRGAHNAAASNDSKPVRHGHAASVRGARPWNACRRPSPMTNRMMPGGVAPPVSPRRDFSRMEGQGDPCPGATPLAAGPQADGELGAGEEGAAAGEIGVALEMQGFALLRLDNWAHAGGFLAGFIVAAALPRPRGH